MGDANGSRKWVTLMDYIFAAARMRARAPPAGRARPGGSGRSPAARGPRAARRALRPGLPPSPLSLIRIGGVLGIKVAS